MIQSKNEQIYEILLRRLNLTKDTLSIYKFTDEEIKKLIDNEIIKEISDGNYILPSTEGMCRYGIKLSLNKQIKKAEECFRICHKLDPNNREAILQLLLVSLKTKNYIAIQKYFEIIEQTNPENYIEDNKLYLYLLGMILFRNQEYQDRINNMDFEEILIPYNKEYKNKEKQNKIRMLLINKKYKYAIKLLNDLIREEMAYSTENELLKELISLVISLDNKFRMSIKNALSRKDYISIATLLEEKSKQQYLSNMETYIQIVTKAIIEIKETNTIPKINIYSTGFLYDAIKGNNFKLARELNTNFLIKTDQIVEEDILNILLSDIIHRIEIIEQQEFISKHLGSKSKESTSIEETSKESNTIDIENENNNSLQTLSLEEEMAKYIKESNISFEKASKMLGLFQEQLILIKLIYARDYYIEGLYEEGDKLIKEVEASVLKTNKINNLLLEIENIKGTTHTKKRTKK